MSAPRIPRYRAPIIRLPAPRWYESEALRAALIVAVLLAAFGLYAFVAVYASGAA